MFELSREEEEIDRMAQVLALRINSIEEKEVRECLERSLKQEGVRSLEIVMR